MSPVRLLVAVLAASALLGAVFVPPGQLAGPSPTDDPAPAARPSEEPSPYRPVARIPSLMHGFGAALHELSELLPRTEDRHRPGQLSAWAEVLAELSNAHTQHDREPGYLAMAAETREAALALARTARREPLDEALLAEQFVRIDRSCSTCHDADW